jgi:hypothetical protein
MTSSNTFKDSAIHYLPTISNTSVTTLVSFTGSSRDQDFWRNTPNAEHIAAWKRSPEVIAYLLAQTAQSLADRKRAAKQMLEVDL